MFLRSPLGLCLKYFSKISGILILNKRYRHLYRDFFDFKSPSNLKHYFVEEYIPFLSNMFVDVVGKPSDYVFQCWLQGEENAPTIVKKCMESVRHFSKNKRYVLITAKNWSEWVDLPDFVVKKYNDGKISNAHFADILRLCLLSKYGGYWIDATCLMTGDFPDWIEQSPFFMFGTDGPFAYTEIQNCFIHSLPHYFLTDAWKFLMFKYWLRENEGLNYFFAHFLFCAMVRANPMARSQFANMPKVIQTPTHKMLCVLDEDFDMEKFCEFVRGSFIHKLTYKFKSKQNPQRDGTFFRFITDNDLDYILKCSPR